MFGKLFSKAATGSGKLQAEVPAGLRVYAIGDIHGCLQELDQLHDMIYEDAQRTPVSERLLIYLGDYVDRGPNSAGVIERLAVSEVPGFSRVFLKGNHEEMLQSFLADPNAGSGWRQLGGLETLFSYRLDVNQILASAGFAGLSEALKQRLPPSHGAFLSSLSTSFTVGGYFFCHAGVNPRYALDQQAERDLLWIRDDFLNSKANFGKVIIHGHSPVEAPDVRPNRINIDTGAYATRRLTAVVLEGSEVRFLST